MLIEIVLLVAVFALPFESVNREVGTEIVVVPDAVLTVGVKTAVYEVPEPVKEVMVPPLMLRSPETRSVADSLSVMVNVAVSPLLRAEALLVIVAVGAV
jgi:hypothetical protein